MEVLICKKTLARSLGVSPRTVEVMVAAGRLPPPLRLTAKTLRWRLADINKLLDDAAAAAAGGSAA